MATDCFGRDVDVATFRPPRVVSETKVEVEGEYVGWVTQYDAGWMHRLRSHGRPALASFHDAWLDLMIERANQERVA